VERTEAEIPDASERSRIVELILTTLVYKFPEQTREEIRQMLGLNELKQTRFYQEIAEEERDLLLGRAIPSLLKLGLSVEQIAASLETDVPTVERIIEQQQELN
jgi:predicted transposase YdaD